MKIKIAELHALCVRFGYTGSATDAEAMKAFLTAENVGLKSADGKTDVDPANLDVIVPKKAAKVANLPAMDDDEEPTVKATAPDLSAKIQAEVLAAMKAAGAQLVDAAKRPSADSLSVKTPGELRYEDRQRDKEAIFPNYDTARMWVAKIAAQCHRFWGNNDRANFYDKSLAESMVRKGYSISTQAGGGALLATQFDNSLQRLAKEYGVAERLFHKIEMKSAFVERPRAAAGGLTPYIVADSGTFTESTETLSSIQLNAKKCGVLVKLSQEVVDDALDGSGINFIEDQTREAIRAIKKRIDDACFIGDASATYGGITGIVTAFGATAKTDSQSVIGGDTSDATTLAQVLYLMGLAGSYAGSRGKIFMCSPEVSCVTLYRLGQSQGGVTFQEYAAMGRDMANVLGTPIVPVNSMNSNFNTGGDVVDILYGDPSLAATYGERGAPDVAVSTERYFDSANIGLRVMQRFDFTAHDTGSTTTQSPVAALFQT